MNVRTTTVFLSLAVIACDTPERLSGPSTAPTPATTPIIRSVTPAVATAGSEDITITIIGSGFEAPLSFAVWSADGVESTLPTQYVSDSRLTATIPAKLLKDAASGQVSVVNGDSIGWSEGNRRYPTSNAFSFGVLGPPRPVLSISSLSPATAAAGSGDLTITIRGSGFQRPQLGTFNWSFVVWSAEIDLSTRYVSDTQLTAVIPAKLMKDPASAQLMVVNGDSMGWSDGYRGYPRSNALPFEVVRSQATVGGK